MGEKTHQGHPFSLELQASKKNSRPPTEPPEEGFWVCTGKRGCGFRWNPHFSSKCVCQKVYPMITPRHSRAVNFTQWRPYQDKDSSETWQQVNKGRRPTRRESQSLKAQSLKKINSRKADQLSAGSDPSSVSCEENEQNSRSSNSSELSILEQKEETAASSSLASSGQPPAARTPKRTVHSIVTKL